MKWHWITVIFVGVMILGTLAITSVNAQGKYEIPSWVKGVAGFWAENKITDDDFGDGLSFLVDQEIIKIPKMESLKQQISQLESKVKQLESENVQLKIQQKSPSSTLDIIVEQKGSVAMSEYCKALKEWNAQYKGVDWLTYETKKEFNKLCVTQSTSVSPSTSSSDSNIPELLPQKGDLGSGWKVFGTGTLTPTSKNFYYEEGRQSSYSKDVSIFNEFVMRLFKFTDADLAQDRLEYKRFDIRTKDGGYNEQYLLLNDKDCIVTKIPRGGVDVIYGYCIEENFLIYGFLKGYYPNMESDFMNFFEITRNKI